jgi:hypothetical protein
VAGWFIPFRGSKGSLEGALLVSGTRGSTGGGPDDARRLVAATVGPGTLPDETTWYLVTNLPRPAGPREADSPHLAALLAEIVRAYGIRNWTGQSCKQAKDELGWADFQVRSDIAIRRHQVLVNCAFSFCWAAWFACPAPPGTAPPASQASGGDRGSGPSARRAGARRSAPCAGLTPWITLKHW